MKTYRLRLKDSLIPTVWTDQADSPETLLATWRRCFGRDFVILEHHAQRAGSPVAPR